jgi:DNA-binding SARP family transcriptional activator
LAGIFWGDLPERKAHRCLSTALWHIRRCLPDDSVLLNDAHSVQFDPYSSLWLDQAAFETLASRPNIADLQTAVKLYRGDFLDGLCDNWILSERYRLEAVYFEALARLMVLYETSGDYQAALAAALRLLERDALREDAHRLAMRAYCRLGQRKAALEQYERCIQTLSEELNIQPMDSTSALYQTILEGRFEIGSMPEISQVTIPIVQQTGRSPLDLTAPVRLISREQEMVFLEGCWR